MLPVPRQCFETMTPFFPPFFLTRLRHSKCARACATSRVPDGSVRGAPTRRRERVRSAHGGTSPAALGLRLLLELSDVLCSSRRLQTPRQSVSDSLWRWGGRNNAARTPRRQIDAYAVKMCEFFVGNPSSFGPLHPHTHRCSLPLFPSTSPCASPRSSFVVPTLSSFAPLPSLLSILVAAHLSALRISFLRCLQVM